MSLILTRRSITQPEGHKTRGQHLTTENLAPKLVQRSAQLNSLNENHRKGSKRNILQICKILFLAWNEIVTLLQAEPDIRAKQITDSWKIKLI